MKSALTASSFIELFQYEWGIKAVPVIKKIKARMYHLECHAPQDRRQDIQNAIHKINTIVKQIEDNSSVKASEVFPSCLPRDILNVILEYSGFLSIRDQATLTSSKVIGVMEMEVEGEMGHNMCGFSAAFYTLSDDDVAMSMLQSLTRMKFNAHNHALLEDLLKITPESRRLVDKFNKGTHSMDMPSVCLPENFSSTALTKFTKTSSLQKNGGFDAKEIDILKDLSNLTCFINNDCKLKLSEKSYKTIVRNRNLKILEIHNGRLTGKAFLGAKNPNLTALLLKECSKLGIGVLPQLAKSFPSLRILHIELPLTTKKELHNLDALSNFSSLEYVAFECFRLFNNFQALVDKIATLTMPALRKLVLFYPGGQVNQSAFNKERFPNVVDFVLRIGLYNPLNDFDQAKLALKAPESRIEIVESKENDDSKEESLSR